MNIHRIISILLLVVFLSAFAIEGNGQFISNKTEDFRLPFIDEVVSNPILENVSPELSGAVPLSEFLNHNGTLDLPAGKAGSINIAGWQMVAGQGDMPRFDPQAKGESYSFSNDEYWANGFYFSNNPNQEVRAIAYDGIGNLYIGGEFTTIGYQIFNHIARWDSATKKWHPLGSGVEGIEISALALDGDGYLYAGGNFDSAGTCSAVDGCKNIARWDPVAKKWSSLGNGINSNVEALAFDGSGSLYAGGWFDQAGACSSAAGCNYIARWDLITKTWNPLATGMDSGVETLVWDGSGNLFAGGYFNNAGACDETTGCNFIARWTPGTSVWSSLASGTDGMVTAMALGGDGMLYAGGEFTKAGACSSAAGCEYIASWDLTAKTWSSLGAGVNSYVYAVKRGPDGKVYVGGNFTSAGECDDTDGCNFIASWNSGNGKWSNVGSGTDSNVFTFGVDGDGYLFVGGEFRNAGNCSSQDGCIHIAKWKPAQNKWSSLSSGFGMGVTYDVNALVFDGFGNLFAGGEFWGAGACSSSDGCNKIAKWDHITQKWSSLGTGMVVEQRVLALAPDNLGNLYAGGYFDRAGNCDSGDGCNNIAMWDQAAKKWKPLGSGVDDYVHALSYDSEKGYLYAGGSFDSAGTCGSAAGCNYIARWDPAVKKWSALGNGMDDEVDSLLVGKGSMLYAGGDFNQAGDCDTGDGCTNIAQWNTETGIWSALSTGMDGEVSAMVLDNSGDLYAGGDFNKAGACSEVEGCKRIARWSTSEVKWYPLGSGMAGDVRALAWSGNPYIYAGGSFVAAGECSSEDGCSRIAKWDTRKNEWSPLETGVDDTVRALVSDTRYQLFAGGDFSIAGNTASSCIGRWIYGMDQRSYLPMVVR